MSVSREIEKLGYLRLTLTDELGIPSIAIDSDQMDCRNFSFAHF
jgi:hypothetical protein